MTLDRFAVAFTGAPRAYGPVPETRITQWSTSETSLWQARLSRGHKAMDGPRAVAQPVLLKKQLLQLLIDHPDAGTPLLKDVPAGIWHVTWWDTLKGIPAAPVTIAHPGGLLRLPTPPIDRHAAVVLTR